jgi:hypothetical protein
MMRGVAIFRGAACSSSTFEETAPSRGLKSRIALARSSSIGQPLRLIPNGVSNPARSGRCGFQCILQWLPIQIPRNITHRGIE